MTLATAPDHRELTRNRSADQRPPSRFPQQRSLPILLLPLHLFLLAGWARAAAEKTIDSRWWSSQHLRQFLDEQRPHMLPWFGWLSDHVLAPLAPQVGITVLATQIGIVICLATNHRVKHALWAGIALNLCFTLAGRVNPSAFYLVMQVTMLFALSRPAPRQVALRRAGVWLTLAALVAPFARTLHPRDAIDDPALMLAFLGSVAAITSVARSFSFAEVAEWAGRSGSGRFVTDVLHRRLGLGGSAWALDPQHRGPRDERHLDAYVGDRRD